MEKKTEKKFLNYLPMLIGSAAIISFSFPIDLVRTRLQTNPELLKRGDIQSQYRGFIDCFQRIYQKQKLTAFWKGNGSNLIRFFISQSFNFAWKQAIQTTIRNRFKQNNSHMGIGYIFGINFISGTLGSCMTLAFIYPFDFCRQRLANDVKGNRTIMNILRQVYQTQGIRGIYKGCLNFFITAATFRSFYFGIFDTIKRIQPQNMMLKIFGAYLASICAIYVVYPLDTIRKRMIMAAAQPHAYKNVFDAFQIIYKTEGLKAIFRGGSIIALQAWTSTVILCFYDKMGQDIKKMTSQQQIYETF